MKLSFLVLAEKVLPWEKHQVDFLVLTEKLMFDKNVTLLFKSFSLIACLSEQFDKLRGACDVYLCNIDNIDDKYV